VNFNSLAYLVFLLTVVILYSAVWNRERARDVLLLIASYWFYMSWNWMYAGIILGSTVLDYVIGRLLYREKRLYLRRIYLATSLCANLGILALFKYYNFFAHSAEHTLDFFGYGVSLARLDFLLPVGISFYTFQTMSYTIDIYKGHLEEEKSFIKFAVFVSFFPQLVAGPIVRASQFLPQLHGARQVSATQFNVGITLILQGLFKKIVIADLLAALAVDAAFENPAGYSSFDLYLALCAYAYQIYNDFSGYSDIAIGSAQLLGFQLPENFNGPYLARGMKEFWSRWHISLSTWLRDYLYIPLGGSRRGESRTYFNLMATMLLGGLWHGAAMNFVLWGAYHGFLLVLTHRFPTLLEGSLTQSNKFGVRRILRTIFTFHLILFGWLLFRISSMSMFQEFMAQLGTFSFRTSFSALFYGLLLLGIGMHAIPKHFVQQSRQRIAATPTPLFSGYIAALLLLLWGCSLGAPAFIYFQF